ncbi:MAG: TPM domain-containing protein [Acidobacteriota bacterium]|nr:TPM domain-containing protein [Acidobacteriota bacterium]MDH3523800.1 TPM domain-containing protein [Acidobacteriota bacterium]
MSSRPQRPATGSRRPLRAVPLLLLLLLLLPLGGPPAARALEVPYLSGRVTDLAEMLSPEAEARLDARLERLEDAAGSQLAVLTIPSLEGESLEDFSLRVAETWGLGRADADDGALLLIARDDRKMRLEVGYGLEAILTDAYSRRILDEILQPHFRAGDFDGGVERAVDAAAALIEGNDILPPPAAAGEPAAEGPGRIGGVVFFLCLALPFAAAALSAPGCSAWLFYLLLMPFWAVPGALLGRNAGLLCLAAWAVGFPILRALLPRTRLGKRWASAGPFAGGGRGWSSSSGWSGGSGGGFSGGGFSGGGFSGGGGSFGGGGSSSGW